VAHAPQSICRGQSGCGAPDDEEVERNSGLVSHGQRGGKRMWRKVGDGGFKYIYQPVTDSDGLESASTYLFPAKQPNWKIAEGRLAICRRSDHTEGG
jgi:hypothetical protein